MSKDWAIGQKANVRDVLFDGRRTAPCHYCGKILTRRTATLDHIIPHADGGENHSSNCLLSCYPCNSQRGRTRYSVFLRLIGKIPPDATVDTEIARLLPP